MIINFVTNSVHALKGYPTGFHNHSDLNDASDLKNLIQFLPSASIDTEGRVYLVVRAFNVPTSKDSHLLEYVVEGDCRLFVEDFSVTEDFVDDNSFREFLFQLNGDKGKVTFQLGEISVSYWWEKVSTFVVAIKGWGGVVFADTQNKQFFSDVQSEIRKLEEYLTFCLPISVDWTKRKIAKLKALLN